MENATPLQKTLQEILLQEDFDRLTPFKKKAFWSKMSKEESEMLAHLLVAQGERQLRLGDSTALESFDIALQIAPNSPQLLFQQALAYSSHPDNIRCLTSACTALQATLELDPQFLEAWSAWGYALVRMGMFHNDASYFVEADQKFAQAEFLAEQASVEKRALFYRQWGVVWFLHGKQSGEAHDFHMAMEKYQLASALGLDDADFWNDYGNAISELALLIGRKELFIEAQARYRKAVKLLPNEYRGWLNLACCCRHIYEHNNEEIYFDYAMESFTKSSELRTDDVNLWLNWGLLYFYSGKHKTDIEHVQTSLEKFCQAYVCDSDHPAVLCRWGEAQMLYAACKEDVDLLREAELKIVRSLEIAPDNIQAWCVYGNCLNELGRYFGDPSFYEQAIEKFEYALTLNPHHPLLWYGLSLAHFSMGEIKANVEMIEKAARCCSKVMECGGQSYPQFWNDWGVALMKLAELNHDQNYIEAAIEKFERAIGQPSEWDADECELEWLYNYACALDFLGEFTEDPKYHEKAILVLLQVLQHDPNYFHARYNLALAYFHHGDLSDNVESLQNASDYFQILLSEDNEDETAWCDWGMALMHLALLTQEAFDGERSQKLFLQSEEKLLNAVALGNTSALYNLACLYSLTGNFQAAMHFVERAELVGALPSIDDLLHDDWLEDLRDTSDFRHFITLLSNKYEKEKP